MTPNQTEAIAQAIDKAVDALTDREDVSEAYIETTTKEIIAAALEGLSPTDTLAVCYRVQTFAKAKMAEILDEVAKVKEVHRLARAAGMPDGIDDIMQWLHRHGLAFHIPNGWIFRRRDFDGKVTWVPIAYSLLEGHGLLEEQINAEINAEGK
jgi:hypothetical protein